MFPAGIHQLGVPAGIHHLGVPANRYVPTCGSNKLHLLPGGRWHQHCIPWTLQVNAQQCALLQRSELQHHWPQKNLPWHADARPWICLHQDHANIPTEFIQKYKLADTDRGDWIYFKICQGCYVLPQAGILANDLLQSPLLAEGYYKAESTPGLWRHKWRPIQFCLIVDDFGVEYVGIEHFNHLLELLKRFHGVQYNMASNKFVGIDIKWDYPNCCCCISMSGYINNILIKFKHPRPASLVSPHTNACQSPMVPRLS